MNINKKTLFLLIICGLVGILIIVIAIINLSLSRQQTTYQAATTPTPVQVEFPPQTDSSSPPIPAQGTEYNQSVRKIQEEEKQAIYESSQVGKLLDILPYTGTNFSLSYSYSKNVFTLVLNGQNQSLGNAEFDRFLQQQGIQNRSWIKNLVIQ